MTWTQVDQREERLPLEEGQTPPRPPRQHGRWPPCLPPWVAPPLLASSSLRHSSLMGAAPPTPTRRENWAWLKLPWSFSDQWTGNNSNKENNWFFLQRRRSKVLQAYQSCDLEGHRGATDRTMPEVLQRCRSSGRKCYRGTQMRELQYPRGVRLVREPRCCIIGMSWGGGYRIRRWICISWSYQTSRFCGRVSKFFLKLEISLTSIVAYRHSSGQLYNRRIFTKNRKSDSKVEVTTKIG